MAATNKAGIKACFTWLFIGSNLSMSNLALSLIVLLIIANAGVIRNDGTDECCLTKSSQRDRNDLKGELNI